MSEHEKNKVTGNSLPNRLLVLVIAPIMVGLVAGGTAPWWSKSSSSTQEKNKDSSLTVVTNSPPTVNNNQPEVAALPSESVRSVNITGSGNTVNDSSVNLSGETNSVTISRESEARSRGELEVPNVAGLTYHEARKLILKEGWIPNQQHWSYKNNINLENSNGQAFWAQGYSEVEACAPTGYANCKFVFSDPSGRQLIIGTKGMEDPIREIEAIVTGVKLQ